MQDRRDKGICYRCDEKFFIGHRCKNKQLHVLLVEEDDAEKGTETKKWEQDQPVFSDAAELSLNSVVGISTLKTMKLRGRVMDQEVVVLIIVGLPIISSQWIWLQGWVFLLSIPTTSSPHGYGTISAGCRSL